MPAHLLFLVGFMGAGKTTVGRALAQKLGWEFMDLDQAIEQQQQRSIAEIFAAEGEAAFREHETRALQRVLQDSKMNKIVALGGGAFTVAKNRELIRQAAGATVWLDAPLDELLARCRQQEDAPVRPLLDDEEHFRQLCEHRRAAYAQADRKFSTAGTNIEAVVYELTDWISNQRSHRS